MGRGLRTRCGQARTRQPLRPRLRRHGERQAAHDLRVELPTERIGPRRAPAGRPLRPAGVPGRSRRLARTIAAIAGAAAVAVLAIVGFASSGSSPAGRLAAALPSEHLAGPPPPSLGGGGRSKLIVFW